jgi:LacI family transcriptional regulator
MPRQFATILLLTYLEFGYSRQVLRGVKRYARGGANWLFRQIETLDPAVPRVLAEHRPAGIIAQIAGPQLADLLVESGIPAVNASSHLGRTELPQVAVDNVAVGRMAAEHFLDRAFRHFAFVGYPSHHYSRQREAGYAEMVRQSGAEVITFDPPAATAPASRPELRDWLTALPRPCAVFAASDRRAAQVAEAAQQADIRLPDDIALLGVDNDDLVCDLAHPPISSIATPADRIGYEAAALLDRLIAGEPPPAQPILLPPISVVTRQSSDILALDDPEVAAALRHIRQYLHRRLTISDLLQHVPVARRTLEKKFRAVLGRSIADELRRARVERAKELLSGTDAPMPLVAQRSGFATPQWLANVFREHTGITPGAYRRQFRNDG